MPNLFIFSLISSNFRANVVCSGKHRPFSYELCHFARHFSLEKFRLVENRLKGCSHAFDTIGLHISIRIPSFR